LLSFGELTAEGSQQGELTAEGRSKAKQLLSEGADREPGGIGEKQLKLYKQKEEAN
jgi:hypothetical protein